MRSRVSALVLAVLVWAPSAVAADAASVYSDYAEDRALSCTHSRADLQAALNDATLNQYGDPYTLIGLKLAIRKQLAGSCGRVDEGGRGQDGRLRVLGAGLLLVALGTAGWVARRAFNQRR